MFNKRRQQLAGEMTGALDPISVAREQTRRTGNGGDNIRDVWGSTVDSGSRARPGRGTSGLGSLQVVSFLLIGVLLAGLPTLLAEVRAEDPATVLPDIPRDPAIQSPAAFFGFPIGSRHLRHDQITAYFQYLAEVSNRAVLLEYGVTHGKRPLFALAISSPENIEQLERLKRRRRTLTQGADPVKSPMEPLVMWLGYCVHGDEASAVNAAPLVAFHLLSGQSESLNQALTDSVFLLDPAMNPDGVDRFANWANENRGRFASDDPLDREHLQDWPGGRGNYYWFDLNRDWLPAAHPESQGRLRLFHEWKPNVVLDYHEMGGDSTYFFQPGIPARTNPLSPAANLRLTKQFAERFATVMDEAGERYYTEESFDDFYIGKGSTYPDLNGAIGILFEQGSTRGLKLKNQNTDRQFGDTIANQVRTTLTAIDTAVEKKVELLEFQSEFYRDARREARSGSVTAYVLIGTASRIRAAQELLQQHDIKTHSNNGPVTIDGVSYEPGTCLVIPMDQPQVTLVRSLMETPQNFRENIFYDVSAWHLPSSFDLDWIEWTSDIPAAWLEPRREQVAEPLLGLDADSCLGLAFSPVELETPTWVAKLLREDVKVRVSMKGISFNADDDAAFPPGTYVILKSENPKSWKRVTRQLERWTQRSSVRVAPIGSGLTVEGPDLGSSQLRLLPKPKVGLVVGAGTTSTVAGAVWHYLDHRLEQPAVMIDASRVARSEDIGLTCLILPEGSFGSWGGREVEALTGFVRRGGTLIGIGSAVDWLQANGLARENAGPVRASLLAGAAEEARSESESEGPLMYADASDRAALERIAGAFFLTRIDPTHPLAFGFPDAEVPVFRDSATAYGSPTNPYQLVAGYQQVIAGYVSQRNREKLQGTAGVWVQNFGSGRVVLLADNPVFRGYVRSSERFLSNGILLGPLIDVPSAPREE